MLNDNLSIGNADLNGTSTPYRYSNQYQGQQRKVKVIVVGAGLSGIAAVKIFKDTFKDGETDLVLYEKNHEVTGTWLENRYPG